MSDENVFQVSLLGVVRKPKSKIDLLYSLTSHRPRAKISNLIQVAGTILGQSRNIFLGKILTILRFFDPSLVEIAYHGELTTGYESFKQYCSLVYMFQTLTALY